MRVRSDTATADIFEQWICERVTHRVDIYVCNLCMISVIGTLIYFPVISGTL